MTHCKTSHIALRQNLHLLRLRYNVLYCFLHMSPIGICWTALCLIMLSHIADSEAEDVVHFSGQCFGSFDLAGIYFKTAWS